MRRTWQTGAMAGRTFSGDDIAILRPEEIRQLEERHALVLAENGKPIIARLTRCIDGKAGRWLLGDQKRLRAQLAKRRLGVPVPARLQSLRALIGELIWEANACAAE
jgi:type IV secretion system protein VirD4